MRRAFVRLDVIPGTIACRCFYSGCEPAHLISAAEVLEKYARRPIDYTVQQGVTEIEGDTFDDDTQVAVVLFEDDEYELKLYNRKIKPFHAFGSAAFLRQHAERQFISECVVQAMQAISAARAAANGEQQAATGPKGIFLPGR